MGGLPAGYVNSLLLKMAIEIVHLPMTHGDFPVRYVNLPKGNQHQWGFHGHVIFRKM